MSMLVIASLLLVACGSSGQRLKTETIHAEAYYLEDKDCWCIGDEDLNLLYKEATRECGR
jgi:major membrane immunogen (membrane-anchored lipoprotein)